MMSVLVSLLLPVRSCVRSRGALQIEDLSVEDLHPYKNDPRIKNKQTNSAVSLPRPELRNLQTLRPYQHNARTHSKRQLEQIGQAYELFESRREGVLKVAIRVS